uniref:Uncharacterized protein n=1 Tax=Rhizophora mucronata TaxID=61149 RepID=A0A2P2PPY5_RHIMU
MIIYYPISFKGFSKNDS